MINFDAETHTYTNEKGEQLISVTTLLKNAGISPNYDFVNEDVLKAAADRGTFIHKEIEEWIKYGKAGFSRELEEFARYVTSEGIKVLASEKQVNNEHVAGTIDLIVQDRFGKIIYVDLKTTSTIHKQSVQWQLSIYKDLDLNNKYENHKDYENATLQVWHFDKEGNLEVKELMEVANDKIKELYECYANNTEYVIKLEEDNLTKLYEAEKIIAHYETLKKKAEKDAEAVRQKIIESMKANGLTKFENDKIAITFIAATTAEKFYSTTFKKENPELYKQFLKTSQIKEQVRIKIKENEDE